MFAERPSYLKGNTIRFAQKISFASITFILGRNVTMMTKLTNGFINWKRHQFSAMQDAAFVV